MTPAGRGTFAAGILIALLGVATGYPAVTAMGATLVVAVLVALILLGRPPDLTTSRVVRPDRVTAGDPVISELTITNRGRRASSASRGEEKVGAGGVGVDIPSIDAGESAVLSIEVSTVRRGTFDIGPLAIQRGDPIGLARRGDLNSEITRLIVHPRIHEVSPFPAGIRRDLDGVPSGEAAEGGITFSNLRDYVPGDDLRLVHWRSSARVGHLMVRHNVDVTRPPPPSFSTPRTSSTTRSRSRTQSEQQRASSCPP